MSPPPFATTPHGGLLVPSAQKRPDGAPRFLMRLPKNYTEDPGLCILVDKETAHAGFEYPYRAFLDAHLRPRDIFVDVGAHFGIYSLSAATASCGDVRVIAIEPEPHNLAALRTWIADNGCQEAVEVIPAACGATPGKAALGFLSTMGHTTAPSRLAELGPEGMRIEVDVVTVDSVMARLNGDPSARLFLKVDVEGTEVEVLAGARAGIESGRVAAIIFEKGPVHNAPKEAAALDDAIDGLRRLGYRIRWFPHPHLPGALIPWAPGNEVGNLIAIAPELDVKPVYDGPATGYPLPPPPLDDGSARRFDDAAQAALTRRLVERGATDGWRWAQIANLDNGAEARAAMIAPYLPRDGSLLDLGAGRMALFGKLPIAVKYDPLDLFRLAKATIVADLNDGGFPNGHWDTIVALDILEFLHDVPGLLSRSRRAADRLILSYRRHSGESLAGRRAAGYFNDFSEDGLRRMLGGAGWKIVEHDRRTPPYTVFVCD